MSTKTFFPISKWPKLPPNLAFAFVQQCDVSIWHWNYLHSSLQKTFSKLRPGFLVSISAMICRSRFCCLFICSVFLVCFKMPLLRRRIFVIISHLAVSWGSKALNVALTRIPTNNVLYSLILQTAGAGLDFEIVSQASCQSFSREWQVLQYLVLAQAGSAGSLIQLQA